MFDFSPAGILTAIAVSFWTSLSARTVVAILGAVAAAVLAGASRSPVARGVFLGIGVALTVSAGAWQSAATDGARRMLQRDHALAVQAERARAEAADAITRDLAEQATRDLADAQADNAKLKELNDALSRDPRGAHPAVPRDLARRLRSL